MFCFERMAHIYTIHYLCAWEDILKCDVCTDTFLSLSPGKHTALTLSPGSEVLSQGQQSPSPPLCIMFFKTSYRLQIWKGKKNPTPAKQLKERLCTVWNSKIKSCHLLQPVTSEQTADSPAAPSPADCPELGGLSQFHLLALPRQFSSGFRCCLSEERESHTWGPIWMRPSQVTPASARLRSSLSQGAFLPPFDPEGTFVLIFSLLCYCFLGFTSYSQRKERKKIFHEIKISLQKIFFFFKYKF